MPLFDEENKKNMIKIIYRLFEKKKKQPLC